jgi:hypothetical protein
MGTHLPPSLAVVPNIAWDHQTLDQLRAERAYWGARLDTAAGPASAGAITGFRDACDAWIAKREREAVQ